MSEEISDEELTMRALVAAKDAFNKTLEDAGVDGAFWDFRFTAWIVDSAFTTRLTKIELEHEVKE